MTLSERIAVVHVVLRFDKGGLEMTALNLCRQLAAQGHRSAVIALDGGGATFDLAQSEGFECVAMEHRRLLSWKFHRNLRGHLRRLNPRVVHTHHFGALLHTISIGWPASTFRRVHTEHSCAYLYPRPGYRRVLRWMSRSVDVFVPVAESMAAYYENEVGIRPSSLRIIANGVDAERFTPASNPAERALLRARLGLTGGLTVGSVGRLSEEKNYALLLRAVAACSAEIPDLQLVLIGEGPDRSLLEGEAARLGIASRVLFAGWRHDTEAWLRALDLFALSSKTEALPVALLEAMASGLPVLATAVGDVPGILRQSGAGVTVAPDDESGFSEGLAALLRNDEGRQAMAANARLAVLADFSIERMTAGYLDAYQLGHQPTR
jgi:glycosyltransferase involved in cell wall biosynthesis